MKRMIIKIAAATLLIGGLALNFTLNTNVNNQDTELLEMISANKAQAEGEHWNSCCGEQYFGCSWAWNLMAMQLGC